MRDKVEMHNQALQYSEEILAEAFANVNDKFMNDLPENIEPHLFSRGFERKMKPILRANRKFKGRIWMERTVRYASIAATMVVCLLAINQVSVKAFNYDIWEAVITKTKDIITIHFEKEIEEPRISGKGYKLKISNLPEGYELTNEVEMEKLTIQNLKSDRGTVSYIESEITTSVNIYSEASLNSHYEEINGWQVTYLQKDGKYVGIFTDEEYYHIVEVQGEDANIEFINEIIRGLEER